MRFSFFFYCPFLHFRLETSVRFLSSSAAYDAQLHHRRFQDSGVQGSLQIIFGFFLNIHFNVCLFFLCEICRYHNQVCPVMYPTCQEAFCYSAVLVSTNPTTCRRNHETVKLCSSPPLLSEGVRNRPIPVTHLIACVYLLLFPCLNCSLFPTDIDYPDDEITDAPITSFDFSDWLFDFLDISKWI